MSRSRGSGPLPIRFRPAVRSVGTGDQVAPIATMEERSGELILRGRKGQGIQIADEGRLGMRRITLIIRAAGLLAGMVAGLVSFGQLLARENA